MASEPVDPQRYPECGDLELRSECGRRARFVGRRVAGGGDVAGGGRVCPECGTGEMVAVYQGPQHGLAFDEPVNPFGVAPVELRLGWCSRHGSCGVELVRADGSVYDGV